MGQYIIRSPRYYEGRYIDASPENPQVVEVHSKYRPEKDDGLVPYVVDQPVVGVQLKPHFHAPSVDDTPASADVLSIGTDARRGQPVPPAQPAKGSNKRASDQDV